jgi:hypothetical protein
VHGGREDQIVRDQGQQTYEAAECSSRRELALLDNDEGGVEHCSNDNLPRTRTIICDCVPEVLRA